MFKEEKAGFVPAFFMDFRFKIIVIWAWLTIVQIS